MSEIRKSFSALEQFLFCERQFYYRRIAKKPEPDNFYFRVGNYYHDAIARQLTNQRLDLPKGYQDEIITNLDRLLKEIAPLDITQVEVWSDDINPDAKYCAKLDAISSVTPVVDENGKITGSKAGPCVIDWKTIFGHRRRDLYEVIESPQLALYALESGTKAAAFVEIPRDHRSIRTLVVEYTADELKYWEKYLDEQFKAMQQRGPKEESYHLAAYGTPRCSKKDCPHWEGCPGGGK